ncbi:MAG TPA: tyrosine-type recombinase/integrase [Armatimonadota bacterium]|jgi:integrase/recombinase XerD
MDFTMAAEGFFQYLEYERGCTAATSGAYRADLRRCIAFLGEIGVAPEVEAITQPVVRQDLVWMGERGYAPSTVRRRIAALSSLYRYLVNTDALTYNPCLGLALPKKRRRLPAVLTVEEAKRLLQASERHTNLRTAFRNRAIIAVLLYCGLRRGEVLGLRVADVDLKSGWLKVHDGKGMKDRLIPMVPAVGEIIADWLEFRPAAAHEFIFTGREGKPLSIKGLIRAFQLVKRRAGLVREGITPHTLRHTFASLLLQEGCDLVSIKEMLGHQDLATTSIYLHVSAPHLQAAVALHPLRWGGAGGRGQAGLVQGGIGINGH